MSTPPGQYATLDQLTAAAAPAAAASAVTVQPFESQTQPPAITFGPAGGPAVSMPGFWITPADSLQISVWNSNPALTAVTVQLRVLRPDGSLDTQAFTIGNITSDRVVNQQAFTQLEGFIVAAVVGPPGVPLVRGQCFVSLALIRGAAANPLEVMVLLSDYMTSVIQPNWPYGRAISAVEGSGWVHTVVSAAPFAGTPVQIAQPPGTRWRLISLSTVLTTSNFPGPRPILLNIEDAGGNTVMLIPAVASQPASSTWSYVFGATLPLFQAGNNLTAPLPAAQIMAAGTNYEVGSTGLSGADQFAQSVMAVEEWIDV